MLRKRNLSIKFHKFRTDITRGNLRKRNNHWMHQRNVSYLGMCILVRNISRKTRSITGTMRLAGILDQYQESSYDKDTIILQKANHWVWYTP